ncbi:MAG: nuclear transport factor 2 family protein [Bacteroidota bacterium]
MATTTHLTAQIGSGKRPLTLENHLEEKWSQTETNHVNVVIDFIEHLMNQHDFEYIQREFGSSRYKQHNRSMTDGIAGVIEVVSGVVKRYPEYGYDVRRIIPSRDYVYVHSHVTMKAKHRGNDKKGYNIMDVWRLEDGRLVEHWDAVQPLNGFWRFYSWLTGGKIRNANTPF